MSVINAVYELCTGGDVSPHKIKKIAQALEPLLDFTSLEIIESGALEAGDYEVIIKEGDGKLVYNQALYKLEIE